MPQKMFISWSGPLGRQIAEELKEQILDDSGIFAWVSSQNIGAGEPFFTEIDRAAKECDMAIGCITPGAARRPWINFEFGLLYGRLKNFKILLFEEQLDGPLQHIQSLNGLDKDDLLRLLETLIPDHARVQRHLDRVFENWKGSVRKALESREGHIKLSATAMSIFDSVLMMTDSDCLVPNRSFQEILNASLSRVGLILKNVTDTYSALQSEYPYNLIDVQSKFDARVDAVAVLEKPEKFWQGRLGGQIRDSAHKDSRRVFVLQEPAQLNDHWETLISHAKSYKVFLLAQDVLVKYFEHKLTEILSMGV